MVGGVVDWPSQTTPLSVNELGGPAYPEPLNPIWVSPRLAFQSRLVAVTCCPSWRQSALHPCVRLELPGSVNASVQPLIGLPRLVTVRCAVNPPFPSPHSPASKST